MKNLIYVLALVLPAVAQSQQWSGVFNPTTVYVTAADNYHVRVTGMPAVTGCTAAPWAYINQNDSGARDQIAAVMLAFAMGRKVSLFAMPDATAYCRILAVEVFQ